MARSPPIREATVKFWLKPGRSGCLAVVTVWALIACTPDGSPELVEYHRGLNALAQQRHDWARLHFQQAYSANSSNLDALKQEGLAWLAGYQRSLSSGVERLEAYLVEVPDDEDARLRAAAALLQLGEAERSLEHLRVLEPGPLWARLFAQATVDSDPAAALSAVERELAANPDPGERAALLALAARAADTLDHTAEALKLAERALNDNPLDYETHYLMARRSREAGDAAGAEQAIAAFEVSRRLRADGALRALSATEEAEALEELVALSPNWEDSSSVRRRRFLNRLVTGDASGAHRDLAWLRDRDLLSVGDLLAFAVACERAGFRTLSRSLLDDVLQASPENKGALGSLALLALEGGRFAEARRLLDKGLLIDPYFARFHYLAARVHQAEDRAGEARSALGQAVLLAPWEGAWRAELASLHRSAGNGAEAERLLAAAPQAARTSGARSRPQ